MRVSLTLPLPLESPRRPAESGRSAAQGLAELMRRQWGTLPAPVTVHHEWFMGDRSDEPGSLLPKYVHPKSAESAQNALTDSIKGVVAGGLIPGERGRQLQWGQCDLHLHAQHKGRGCVVLTFEYFDPFYDGWDPIDDPDEDGSGYGL